LCIKLVKYRDKYTQMHGQQNVKKYTHSRKGHTVIFYCSRAKRAGLTRKENAAKWNVKNTSMKTLDERDDRL